MVAFNSGDVLTASALNSALNTLSINAQTGTTYQPVLTDHGGLVTLSNASGGTLTIPANATVAFSVGDVIQVLNIGAGSWTVAAAGGVTLNGSTTTLAQNASVTLVKLATNTWNAVAGGGLPKATVTSTTGTPTVTSYTSGATTYDVWKYTGTGTITFGTAGLIDFLVVAGGGGGNAGAGAGAGGMIDTTQSTGTPLYVTPATVTITVGGASGAQGTGNDSAYGTIGISATGGGPANTYSIRGGSGGAAGGGGAGINTIYQGTLPSGSTGGGAGGVGTGKASSITGTAVTYATGAAGGAGAGTANTGNGGGSGQGGGSGVVIIRIAR